MNLRLSLLALLSLTLAFATWSIGPNLVAQDAVGEASVEATEEPQEEDSHRRLPPYFSDLVTEGQRSRIYAIQDKYEPRIEELKKQLRDLVAEREAEIEAVLVPEQRELLAVVKEQSRLLREARAKAAARLNEEVPDDVSDDEAGN